jgi:hypothetical protein
VELYLHFEAFRTCAASNSAVNYAAHLTSLNRVLLQNLMVAHPVRNSPHLVDTAEIQKFSKNLEATLEF